MKRKLLVGLTAIALLALIAAACGGSEVSTTEPSPVPTATTVPSPSAVPTPPLADEGEQDDGNQQGEVIELKISVGELFFQVEGQEKNSPLVLETGMEYELVFKNVGMVLHVVILGRQMKLEQGMAAGYQELLLEDVEVETLLEPGVELRVAFTLPDEKAGKWEVECFIPGHYEAGMHAPLSIKCEGC